jgi:predicted transcriptional regulator
MPDILMPIKPKWAEKIYSGEKNIEVRKVFPRESFNAAKRNIIYFYESKPVQLVTGFAEVSLVYERTIECAMLYEEGLDNWRMCLTEKELTDYANGRPELYYIEIDKTYKFKNPVKLATAPQSYFYVSDRYAQDVLGRGEGGFNA